MPLAIFDLDETLIAADSDHEWGRYICDQGLVDADQYRARNQAFYEEYKAGQLNIDEYLAFVGSVLTRYPIPELHRYRSAFIRERIAPLMLDKARALVDEHREGGDMVMVITSTMAFVSRPIARAFGIDILIAPEPEIVNDHYTGRFEGVPAFAEGKVTRLKSWMAETGNTLAGSHFYSDSHNDLPLLRLVDNPVAVDPDPGLRAEAEANNWRVISLREPG